VYWNPWPTIMANVAEGERVGKSPWSASMVVDDWTHRILAERHRNPYFPQETAAETIARRKREGA